MSQTFIACPEIVTENEIVQSLPNTCPSSDSADEEPRHVLDPEAVSHFDQCFLWIESLKDNQPIQLALLQKSNLHHLNYNRLGDFFSGTN